MMGCEIVQKAGVNGQRDRISRMIALCLGNADSQPTEMDSYEAYLQDMQTLLP